MDDRRRRWDYRFSLGQCCSANGARQRCGARLVWLALLAAALLTLPPAVLAFSFEPSEKDYYLYPDFCKAKMSDFHRNRKGWWDTKFPINEAQIAFWSKAVGPDWPHLHHYCAGLTNLSQANDVMWLRKSRLSARQRFGHAVRQIEYTLSRSKPGHPLWEQMSLKYAEALGGAGQYADAMEALGEVLARNPKNEQAYALMGRLTKRRGNLNEAIAYLEQGLEAGAKPGPLLFYLADYYFDLGDYRQAQAYMERAEAAGMKMDRLKRKLPDSYAGTDAD
jgi:tetratricopeptide (TPR) repeat protein